MLFTAAELQSKAPDSLLHKKGLGDDATAAATADVQPQPDTAADEPISTPAALEASTNASSGPSAEQGPAPAEATAPQQKEATAPTADQPRAGNEAASQQQPAAALEPASEPATGSGASADSKPGATAAQRRQQAAYTLRSLGLPWSAAWAAVDSCPQLIGLPRRALKPRIDALAAAFGGDLTPNALGVRIKKAPAVLTMPAVGIKGAQIRLLQLGLSGDEVATMVAAQPGILLLPAAQLQGNAKIVRGMLELSAEELQHVFIKVPHCLLEDVTHRKDLHAHLRSAARRRLRAGKHRMGPKVGVATFQ